MRLWVRAPIPVVTAYQAWWEEKLKTRVDRAWAPLQARGLSPAFIAELRALRWTADDINGAYAQALKRAQR